MNFLKCVVPEPLKIQCLLDWCCICILLLVHSSLCCIKLLLMKVMCCTFRFGRGIVSDEKFGTFTFFFCSWNASISNIYWKYPWVIQETDFPPHKEVRSSASIITMKRKLMILIECLIDQYCNNFNTAFIRVNLQC